MRKNHFTDLKIIYDQIHLFDNGVQKGNLGLLYMLYDLKFEHVTYSMDIARPQ